MAFIEISLIGPERFAPMIQETGHQEIAPSAEKRAVCPVDQLETQLAEFPGRDVVTEAGTDEQTIDRICVRRLVAVPVTEGQIHHGTDDVTREVRTLGIGNVHQGDQDAQCDPGFFLFHRLRIEQPGRFASPKPEPCPQDLRCNRGRTRFPGQGNAHELQSLHRGPDRIFPPGCMDIEIHTGPVNACPLQR